MAKDLQVRFPPEDVNLVAAKLPNADAVDSAAQVNWRLVPGSAQGIVDFGPFMEYGEHLSSYALFPDYSLEDQQVAILIGTDDQALLWLNDECVYESLRFRAAIPDEDAVPVMLKSGWNSHLVRVTNETEHHALYLRISTSADDLKR